MDKKKLSMKAIQVLQKKNIGASKCNSMYGQTSLQINYNMSNHKSRMIQSAD